MTTDTNQIRRALEALAIRIPLSRTAIDALVLAAVHGGLRGRGIGVLQDPDACRNVHLVTAGVVRLEHRYDRDDDVRPLIADFFVPGDLLWLPAPTTVPGWTASLRAHEPDTRVAHIERTRFERILARQAPESLASVVLTSLQNAAHAIAARTLLLTSRLEKRFLAAFGMLAPKFGVPHPFGIKLALRLTHREWSGLIGCTRENATRLFKRLRRAKRVFLEDGYLVVTRGPAAGAPEPPPAPQPPSTSPPPPAVCAEAWVPRHCASTC